MQVFTLFKVLKAALLFVREIWLRDRTFRQFVRENLSLIVSSLGFVIMTMMFMHVYFIVKDQEAIITKHENDHAALKSEYEPKVSFLTERMEWYRERYYELKAPKSNSPSAHKEPTPPQPRPKQPAEKPIANRPPPNDLVERWKRLSQ
ncbi:hypothetical protein D3C76_36740 [compost metagenome]